MLTPSGAVWEFRLVIDGKNNHTTIHQGLCGFYPDPEGVIHP
jgi:hypothetical protein